MGCESLDAIKLTGFLELLSGQKIEKHLRRIEEVMGPIQERLMVASEMEAVEKEAATSKKKDDFSTHEYTVVSKEHPPLPKLKVSYD